MIRPVESTIANLIPRFYNQSSGEILIDGKSISEGEVPTVKQKIKTKKRKFFFF